MADGDVHPSLLPKGWLHPDAPFAVAAARLESAAGLLRSAHYIALTIAQPPQGMIPEAVTQRNAFLKISLELIRADAIRETDEFYRHWTEYKRMLREEL